MRSLSQLNPNLRKDLPIGVLGAAVNRGQPLAGVELGPTTIRQSSKLLNQLKLSGAEIKDWGNFGEAKDDKASHFYFKLSQRCYEVAYNSRFSVYLGGDHSVALSTIAALRSVYPDLLVIWVDAHGDINTPSTSPSGNLHGMPLAALFGLFDEFGNERVSWVNEPLTSADIGMIGLRDLDPGEQVLLKDLSVPVVSHVDLRHRGMRQALRDILQILDPHQTRPIHLSFDIDSMDEPWAYATGLPVPGGLNPDDVWELGRSLSATRRWVSADMVELNPLQVGSSEELSRSLMGFEILGHWIAHSLLQSPEWIGRPTQDHRLSNHGQH